VTLVPLGGQTGWTVECMPSLLWLGGRDLTGTRPFARYQVSVAVLDSVQLGEQRMPHQSAKGPKTDAP
jgi:hypothetical protein